MAKYKKYTYEELKKFCNDAFEKIGESKDKNFKEYECPICGWVYSEKDGLPSEGIPAGTKFEDLPEHFACPICGVNKAEFTEK